MSADGMLVEMACHLGSEAIRSPCVSLQSPLPDPGIHMFQVVQLQDGGVFAILGPPGSEGSRAPCSPLTDSSTIQKQALILLKSLRFGANFYL